MSSIFSATPTSDLTSRTLALSNRSSLKPFNEVKHKFILWMHFPEFFTGAKCLSDFLSHTFSCYLNSTLIIVTIIITLLQLFLNRQTHGREWHIGEVSCYDLWCLTLTLTLTFDLTTQNLISSSLDHLWLILKISSKFVQEILSYVVHRRTNSVTDKWINK